MGGQLKDIDFCIFRIRINRATADSFYKEIKFWLYCETEYSVAAAHHVLDQLFHGRCFSGSLNAPKHDVKASALGRLNSCVKIHLPAGVSVSKIQASWIHQGFCAERKL